MKEPSGLSIGGTMLLVCIAYIIGILVGIAIHWEFSIRPLDVYRGKTTLEITYRDSVAVDSVVVYKVR